MQLLEIQEPEILSNGEKSLILGIDLGTTNSLIAAMVDGEAKILGKSLPSIVSFDGGQILKSFKRSMGSNLIAIEASKMILIQLKKQAEGLLGQEVSRVVITVPAYFDESSRLATKMAAHLAGLEVVRLINEPTAAAFAYGLENGIEGEYLVYDLGGGTFDVSLLNMQMGVFQVLATSGDNHLGGDDFDYAIAKKIQQDLSQKIVIDYQLLDQARKIKHYLTNHEIYSGVVLGYNFSLSRAEFEQLIVNMVTKTCDVLAGILGHSSNIEGIILVGGSTRIPLVRQMLRDRFKFSLITDLDPDEIVALGAATQAGRLSGQNDGLLIDVVPLSLGVEILGGMVDVLIPRNSAIPTAVTREFTTYEDGQSGMKFHVVQGDREMAVDCRSLARFELSNIPNMKAGTPRIEVTFTVDVDGLLTVTAKEQATNSSQEVVVSPSYGLNESSIEQMLLDSFNNMEQDFYRRKLEDKKMDVKILLGVARKITRDSPELLKNIELIFSEHIEKLQKSLTQDFDAIEKQESIFKNFIEPLLRENVDFHLKKSLIGKII